MREELKIVIKEKNFAYTSDYPEGWVFAKGDSFKKVKVAKHTCFIKRFEAKTPETISGWKLMNLLKGKNENNLARIYDIVGTKENGRNIYYVFYEFIDGETLNHLVARHAYVDVGRLTENLFAALGALQKKDYWFPDFIEKNIFCPKMGGYVLIDLDSVHPVSDPPDNDMWADKEYWALVFNFYKNFLGKSHLVYSDVNGISLNYLIVIFMVLRLKLYQSDTGKEYHELFNQLPSCLNGISSSVADIFRRIYQNPDPISEEDVVAIKDFIKSKIINLTNEEAALLMEGKSIESEPERETESQPEPEPVIPYQREPEPEPDPEPIIPYQREPELAFIARFASSTKFIEKGKSITLSWDVKNASKITLVRNGMVVAEPDMGKGSMVFTESYDGIAKEIEFRLFAYNDDGEVQSDPVRIFIEKELIEEEIPEKDKQQPPRKRKLVWLVVFILFLAGILATTFLNSGNGHNKIYIKKVLPGAVFENGQVAIMGHNFPAGSKDLKVLFNNRGGSVLYIYDSLITVIVPEFPKPSGNLLSVAIVVKEDTFYADQKIVLKQR